MSVKSLKELLYEANTLLETHEATLKHNEERKKAIDDEIKTKTMQLFEFLFLNQVKLIEQNEQIEENLRLKSNQLKGKQQDVISKLKEIEQRLACSPLATGTQLEEISNETEQIKCEINAIKEQLNHMRYEHHFEQNKTNQDTLCIGQLLVSCFLQLKNIHRLDP